MPTYIRHIDAHCALGRGVESGVTNLLAGRKFLSDVAFQQLRDPVTIPYFSLPEREEVSGDFYRELRDLAEAALSRLGLDDDARRRTAILLGSSSFDVQVSEAQYRADLQKRGPEAAVPMPIVGYGKLAQRLGETLGLSAQRHTYSTACTSSSNAMLYGHRLLDTGVVDQALVLGLERFNHTSVLGFHGLGLLPPSRDMRPFDRDRDGLLLGEGVGVMLLSREAPEPGEQQWQLCGGAIGTDNTSLTAAHTEGIELARIVSEALCDSQIGPRDVVGVKVHGTASMKNDEAEAAALRRVFGESVPPAFALKPFLGHSLGACGVVEAALTLGCLARGVRPGNPEARSDPELPVTLAQESEPARNGYYLFNCFAFGGNNNALVIAHQDPDQGGFS